LRFRSSVIQGGHQTDALILFRYLIAKVQSSIAGQVTRPFS
jgi:hypothetical protein